MNKEQRIAKKTHKARVRRKKKVAILRNDRGIRREAMGILKTSYLKEKKRLSAKVTKARQERAEELRKIINIPEAKEMTLEALEKLFETMSKQLVK